MNILGIGYQHTCLKVVIVHFLHRYINGSSASRTMYPCFHRELNPRTDPYFYPAHYHRGTDFMGNTFMDWEVRFGKITPKTLIELLHRSSSAHSIYRKPQSINAYGATPCELTVFQLIVMEMIDAFVKELEPVRDSRVCITMYNQLQYYCTLSTDPNNNKAYNNNAHWEGVMLF